jgi:hypothetical protein
MPDVNPRILTVINPFRRKKYMRKRFIILGLMLLILAACNGASNNGNTTNQGQAPANAIEIDIIYAPESDEYMQEIMRRFNEAYRAGNNPVTGERLTSSERPVFIQGQSGSSGVVMQQIVNAVTNPGSSNIAQPTIFQPSVSHWLALANFETRRELFDLADSP